MIKELNDFSRAYNSKSEDKIYEQWEQSGYFNPDNLPVDGDKLFTISMPPPNATGTLHTGHALFLSLEDAMIRYKRLGGFKALWLPGTDHAAIATQTKVEKILLEQERKTRHDFPREVFLQKVKDFVSNSQKTIRRQIKKMGASCDWSREKYTLDEGLNLAVRTQFKNMYEDGLIYRGYRIVNWCPRCHSTLADDEVEYSETTAKFYTFRYTKDFPISISTTRPETKLGDTAVAINPDDIRYQRYIGQTFVVDVGAEKPLNIKIIADESIDVSFGTGALGVTPAHSHVDYEMAVKNNLEIIKVIDEDGLMTARAGAEYRGLTVMVAREKFVKQLAKKDLLGKIEEVPQNLSICYRCSTPIEPLPSLQWFIDVNKKFRLKGDHLKGLVKGNLVSLKELMIQVVKSGQIKIIPERFDKIYFHWIENLRDWCISRQIWFGHRIPVWYRGEEIYIGEKSPDGSQWEQDPDTLDTWFSSGLWTFSTLGWPAAVDEWGGRTGDFQRFHPTQMMETGYDILFFWVARMILMTTYSLGEIPFEEVYLHGLVRDEQGRKMSKSLGNVVDPLDWIDKYGTDALRLTYLIGITPGNDLKLSEEKVAGNRNLVNKLWNISRYILTSTNLDCGLDLNKLTLADRFILSRYNSTVKLVTAKLNEWDFSVAGEVLREFMWSDLADWYLEISKIEKNKDGILRDILTGLLKLWHPFAPFVTEQIWSLYQNKEGEKEKMLMISQWPRVNEDLIASDSEEQFNALREVITVIRNLRAENKFEPAEKMKAIIIGESDVLTDNLEIIKSLARLETVEFNGAVESSMLKTVVAGREIYLSVSAADQAKQAEYQAKEIADLEQYIGLLESKLANSEFVNNAPEKVVAGERKKLAEAKEKRSKLG